MRMTIAAVGQKMPRWVNDGYSEYQRRIPTYFGLTITEIPLPRRGRNADTAQLLQKEAMAIRAALPKHCVRIALDISGQQWSTGDLARRLQDWQQGGRDVGIMIGGPDGLDPDLLSSADQVWSLGPLTLPHPVVRIVLAEQLYRAWTITIGHPYHRD